jgi:PhzF family phenazine biosynthesis protein
MSLELWQVDAFTDRPFAGNPAAVCFLDSPRPDAWLQRVAAEMNLAETAFLLAEEGHWRLRWFTPKVEVDLCGHATLASAHALWQTGRLAPDAEARFMTRSGPLAARRDGEWIELDFPRDDPAPAEAPAELAAALGLAAPPRWCGRTRFDWLLELASESAVRAVAPDFRRLAALGGRGVIATSRPASPAADFVSRFFAPAAGVDEDPVTGSTHCALAPFWAERLGRRELLAHQVSERGGWLRLRLEPERVRIAGQAATVLVGELRAAEDS